MSGAVGMWKCRNLYGGCEKTYNQFWQSSCPRCGCSRDGAYGGGGYRRRFMMLGLDHTQVKSPDAHVWSSPDKKRETKTWAEGGGGVRVGNPLAAERVDVASQDPLDRRESDRSRPPAVEDFLLESLDDSENPGRHFSTAVGTAESAPLVALEHQTRSKDQDSDLISNSASTDPPTHGHVQLTRVPTSVQSRPDSPDSRPYPVYFGSPTTPIETLSTPYAASVVSTTSDSMDSVSSADSTETSATAFSKKSTFAREKIQSATRFFVSFLQEDEVLKPLYEFARNSSKIGPRRLRRHLRQAVTEFAENLKEEADDHLEFVASDLVGKKARYAARCIAPRKHQQKQSQSSVNEYNRAIEDPEDSPEDEAAERAVDEAVVGDLKVFRLFFTESDALVILRAQIQAICTKDSTKSHDRPVIEDLKLATGATSDSQPPQSTRHPDEELLSDEKFREGKELKPIRATRSNIQRTWYAWQKDVHDLASSLLLGSEWIFLAKVALFLLIDVIFLLTDDAFIAIGCLEPPLEGGWTRIRSECGCGNQFFDDFKEQRTGGVARLVQEMKRSSVDAKITISPYRTGATIQKYTARVSMWIHHISSSLLAAFSSHNKTRTGLPLHNAGSTATAAGSTNGTNTQQHRDPVHLMCCVHRSHNNPVLHQVEVHGIRTDQALFYLLRNEITRYNRLQRASSCRSIQGIFFSKFRLRTGGHVDVRDHNGSCLSISSATSYCDCLPPIHLIEPSPNAEYRCDIPCPPDTWPPVGPNTLVHMLKCPKTISERYTWVLHRVPKRIKGELSGEGDQPADGWGFYFKEGWDFDIIITVSFTVFILGSLLFGICWSVLEKDIQGAFGVSAYIVTACGLFVAFVVGKTGKAD